MHGTFLPKFIKRKEHELSNRKDNELRHNIPFLPRVGEERGEKGTGLIEWLKPSFIRDSKAQKKHLYKVISTGLT
jgi:hypothetical protein